jgi:phage/plasmid-like protein (TIGR03299 family)
MPAMVESMFYVRETPWHGLGVRLEEAPNSEEALKAADLDWNVLQRPLYFSTAEAGKPVYNNIPNRVANVRSTDMKVLGIVGNGYQVVQNKDAFEFTDSLLGEGVVYETAGSLWGGSRIWLLARLPDRYKALGDEIEPYICFSNSHNGMTGVQVILTPVRVVCQNTLNMAISGAKRTWSVIHTGNPMERLEEARKTLGLVHHYYETFIEEAEKLVDIKVDFEQMTNKLFPIAEDPKSQTVVKNMELKRKILLELLQAKDLKKFRGTGWGFINGVSDMAGHITRTKNIEVWKQSQILKAFDGYELINQAYALVKKAA